VDFWLAVSALSGKLYPTVDALVQSTVHDESFLPNMAAVIGCMACFALHFGAVHHVVINALCMEPALTLVNV
jgi:hypothetical protein